ncbi:P-type ATPase, subfamily V, partial [Kipferlia bialata]|eukprot:g3124.t1
MCTETPEWVEAELSKATRQGYRVIALAYRRLGGQTDLSSGSAVIRTKKRSEVEKDLVFAGLMLSDSPLKTDTRKTILSLKSSGHRCIMITGDNLHTAAAVARKSAIVAKGRAVMRLASVTPGAPADPADKKSKPTPPCAVFEPLYAEQPGVSSVPPATLPITPGQALPDIREMALCASGNKLDELLEIPALATLVTPLLKVIARCSPDNKAAVVAVLADAGMAPLMCGDGTNDVGALRKAAVGLALMETPDYKIKLQRDAEIAEAKRQGKKIHPLQALGVPMPSVMGQGGRPATQTQLMAVARQ